MSDLLTSFLLYEDSRDFAEMVIRTIKTRPDRWILKEWLQNTRTLLNDMSLHKPGIVLMDIHMEREKEGLEALSVIKQNFPDSKVIVLTDFTQNENIFDAFCLRADGFLDKKAFSDKIESAIEDVQAGTVFINASIAQKLQGLFPKTNSFVTNEPSLTPREEEALNWLARGYSYKMTADKMDIKDSAVMSHVKNMFVKLRVHSATEAVYKAHQKGILRLLNRPFDHWIENLMHCFRKTTIVRFGTESKVQLVFNCPVIRKSLSAEKENELLLFVEETIAAAPIAISRINLNLQWAGNIGNRDSILLVTISSTPGENSVQRVFSLD
ncbi:MAG: response regulator transcription factor [Haliscomenobacter sp.]|uniref:response regulator transcription factor n=1 Tax=Haliscomenobacter sp. TaxID=2717303 RepID=UPI0029AE8E03|nr:response regulator transcription factor [Haliscomenobacter sp.]MDX2072068.1 response regulator transcription factor [Haliscomenobacter sp.]